MDDQITLRIPRALARTLVREARARGVPKSLLVREALAAYLTHGEAASAGDAPASSASFIGTVTLDHDALERDALARQIRRHNWRD